MLIKILDVITGNEVIMVMGDFNSVVDSKVDRISASASGKVLPGNFRKQLKQIHILE